MEQGRGAKITQNTELKSKMEALAQRVSAGAVSNIPPEKDGGLIKFPPSTYIISIAVPSGATIKAAVQKVINAYDRGNFIKPGEGDGFSYKKRSIGVWDNYDPDWKRYEPPEETMSA